MPLQTHVMTDREPLWRRPLKSNSFVRPLMALAWLYPSSSCHRSMARWYVAWLSLGYRPRLMLDDPKHITLIVDVFHFVSLALLVGWPAFMIAGLPLQLAATRSSRLKRVYLTFAYSGFWAATIAFLRWDPLLVLERYLD